MFTRIDHVTICVPDLAQGIEQYRKLGFNIHAGGAHPGKGTHNAIAFNRDDYIELLAIRDQVAPPTTNLESRDADNTLNVIADRALPTPMTHAMTNSFGFGGTNACLIFSAAASGR